MAEDRCMDVAGDYPGTMFMYRLMSRIVPEHANFCAN